jgi:hypothetical protein
MTTRRKFDIAKTYWLNPSMLEHAPWNPPARIDVADRAFQDLMKSIRQDGQQVPIIITRTGLIVDGNRRNAACCALGVKVRAVVSETDDPARAYGVINSAQAQKPIRGIALLQQFATSPDVIHPTTRKRLERMVDELGFKKFQEFLKYKGSIHIWKFSSSVGIYIGSPYLRPKVAIWMAKWGTVLLTRLAMEMEYPKKDLEYKILLDKRLTRDEITDAVKQLPPKTQ